VTTSLFEASQSYLAEIEAEFSAALARDERKAIAKFSFLRIAELERISVILYGQGRLPDTDEGHDMLRVVCDHLAQVDPLRIRRWCAKRGPPMTAAAIDKLIADREAVIAERGVPALFWIADALAHEIDLDYATRTKARATTIGAIDFLKPERDALRRRKNNAAKAAKRRAAGATPRSQSAERRKEWEIMGISRASFYRQRRAARETVSGTAILSSFEHGVPELVSHSASPRRAAERSKIAAQRPLVASTLLASRPKGRKWPGNGGRPALPILFLALGSAQSAGRRSGAPQLRSKTARRRALALVYLLSL
jgi:hypothetical protein